LPTNALYIGLAETCESDPAIDALHQKGVTVLAMERVPRISRAQSMDALSSQSNIGGYRAVLEAAATTGGSCR
jgi:NAD(P) transhydrogenase subunit alpha